jgi:Family of unknown function (DUF6153)
MGWRATLLRWSLVLVLAGGLVAMHSLMLAGGGGIGHPMVMSGPMVTSPAPPSHPVSHAGSEVEPAPAVDDHSGRSGHHGDGMSMLLHLCFAVLGTLLLALAAPLLLAVLDRAARAGSRAGPFTPCTHPRAPPPTPVRLAELCVSRR